jgi:hypothetical protein
LKLTLRSSGGFTGPAGAITHTVDLDALPGARKQPGQALVAAAHLAARPAQILLPHPHPWDFRYQLEIDDAGHTQRIEFHLDAVDASLRALVDWLENDGQ